jgi:Cu/Zn superoxide dismutase
VTARPTAARPTVPETILAYITGPANKANEEKQDECANGCGDHIAAVIHEGGDNYSDNPENGGGKGRVACGVIPKQ